MAAIDVQCPLIKTADLFIYRTIQPQEGSHDLLVDFIKRRRGVHLEKGKRPLRRERLFEHGVVIRIECNGLRNDRNGVHMLLRIIGAHDVLFGVCAESAQGSIGLKGVTRLIKQHQNVPCIHKHIAKCLVGDEIERGCAVGLRGQFLGNLFIVVGAIGEGQGYQKGFTRIVHTTGFYDS